MFFLHVIQGGFFIGDQRPQTIAACLGGKSPDGFFAVALAPPLVAPGPKPPSQPVQRVLFAKTDGAEHLMYGRGDLACGLACTRLGDEAVEEGIGPRVERKEGSLE